MNLAQDQSPRRRLPLAFRPSPMRGEENYPYRGRGVTIPTLEEVLVAFPDVLMAIEMKTADEATQTALGELLKKYNRWDKTIVGSFSRSALRSFRDEYPQALTSASAEESLEYYAFSLLESEQFLDTVHGLFSGA
jgi:glycerophosphoryl diester phosphodiesterase